MNPGPHGEADLHYADGSHRWLSPDLERWSDEMWRVIVAAHMETHRRGDDQRGTRYGAEVPSCRRIA